MHGSVAIVAGKWWEKGGGRISDKPKLKHLEEAQYLSTI